MTSDEQRKAIERFVAGLPVDPEALSEAITAEAVSRAIVVESLLISLASPEPAVRRRAARRFERMPQVDPSVEVQLRRLAVQDEDERTRAACAAALRTHGLPVPGEPEKPSGTRPRVLRWLPLKPSLTRGRGTRERGVPLLAVDRKDAPDFLGRVFDEGDGVVRFELTGLPDQFEDSRPTLRAMTGAGEGQLTPIAKATTPVAGGRVTIRAQLETPPGDLVEWLVRGVEIFVEAD